MPIIKIDGVSYDLEKLAPEVRVKVETLLSVEQRIKELQRDLAITKTARNVYAQALKGVIPNEAGFSAN